MIALTPVTVTASPFSVTIPGQPGEWTALILLNNTAYNLTVQYGGGAKTINAFTADLLPLDGLDTYVSILTTAANANPSASNNILNFNLVAQDDRQPNQAQYPSPLGGTQSVSVTAFTIQPPGFNVQEYASPIKNVDDTVVSVNAVGTSVIVAAANSNRIGLTLYADGQADWYILTAPDYDAAYSHFSYHLQPQSHFELIDGPFVYQGVVKGIAFNYTGGDALRVFEITYI